MTVYEIEAKKRDKFKKGPAKLYRRQGLIPSIIYGQEEINKILINKNEFNKLSHHLTKSTIIKIKLDNKTLDVLIKDFQKDYIKDEFLHIDFYELRSGKPVHSRISLNFVGNAIGVREGGVLEKHLTSVDVECLPKDIVPFIDINIDNLKIGDALHIKDVQFDEKYKILSHSDDVLVHISGKMAEEEVAVEEGVAGEEAAEAAEGEEKAEADTKEKTDSESKEKSE